MKTAVITGSTRGLGFEMARKFRMNGVNVVINGLNEKFVQNNRIDQAIFEAEKEVEEGVAPVSLGTARELLDKEYYGKV